jgi:hypothetical protein
MVRVSQMSRGVNDLSTSIAEGLAYSRVSKINDSLDCSIVLKASKDQMVPLQQGISALLGNTIKRKPSRNGLVFIHLAVV